MRQLSSLIVAGLLLIGCSPSTQTPVLSEEPPRPEKDRQIAEEQQQRERAEIRLRMQEARTSAWQFTSAVAFGLVRGRLDRGSRASSPPVR